VQRFTNRFRGNARFLPGRWRPGRPDLSSFPRTQWASSVRRALSAAPYESLDYTEHAGLPVLRAAVADYVTRARGVRAGPAAVVITAVVVMMCAPGQEMLVYVDDEELEQRRDRRAPRPAS